MPAWRPRAGKPGSKVASVMSRPDVLAPPPPPALPSALPLAALLRNLRPDARAPVRAPGAPRSAVSASGFKFAVTHPPVSGGGGGASGTSSFTATTSSAASAASTPPPSASYTYEINQSYHLHIAHNIACIIQPSCSPVPVQTPVLPPVLLISKLNEMIFGVFDPKNIFMDNKNK